MIFRSSLACLFLMGNMMASAAVAQVLLCPDVPENDVVATEAAAEAEQLLKRLTIALDLHGHRGIDERQILKAHAETPRALLAKLTGVADRCKSASNDLQGFYDALPGLRQAFLEATDIAGVGEVDSEIKTASHQTEESERLEQSIDLSIRELWRKLWFRPTEASQNDDRWAVIVASPADAESGWDELGEHQTQWKDTYFQLHEPYYASNPYHAIVVGRRLPMAQAIRLRDYAVELGMAEDAYLWPLPENDDASTVVNEAKAAGVTADQRQKPEPVLQAEEPREPLARGALDLSVLKP